MYQRNRYLAIIWGEKYSAFDSTLLYFSWMWDAWTSCGFEMTDSFTKMDIQHEPCRKRELRLPRGDWSTKDIIGSLAYYVKGKQKTSLRKDTERITCY